MFKNWQNVWSIDENSTELLAVVTKHLKILRYLTKMSKIGKNL